MIDDETEGFCQQGELRVCVQGAGPRGGERGTSGTWDNNEITLSPH